MRSDFDFESWKSEIQSVPRGADPEADLRFCDLVDAVEGKVDLKIARVLMGTFGAYDDEGVEESVHRVLASVACTVVVNSLLEELPRLTAEAPETAYDLLNQSFRRCASELRMALLKQSPEVRMMVFEIATEVLDDNPKLAAHRPWLEAFRNP